MNRMDQEKRLFLRQGIIAEAQLANDFALTAMPLIHRQRTTAPLTQYPSLLPDIRSFSHEPIHLRPQDINAKVNEILASALLAKRGLNSSSSCVTSDTESLFQTTKANHADILSTLIKKSIATEEPVKRIVAATIPDDTDSDVSSVDCNSTTSSGRASPTTPSKKPRKKDNKWLSTLEELKKYKESHGDCIVPRGYSANPRLASWVAEQRLVTVL